MALESPLDRILSEEELIRGLIVETEKCLAKSESDRFETLKLRHAMAQAQAQMRALAQAKWITEEMDEARVAWGTKVALANVFDGFDPESSTPVLTDGMGEALNWLMRSFPTWLKRKPPHRGMLVRVIDLHGGLVKTFYDLVDQWLPSNATDGHWGDKEHCPTFVAYGVGGQGKTELCREILHDLHKRGAGFGLLLTFGQSASTHWRKEEAAYLWERAVWRRILEFCEAPNQGLKFVPSACFSTVLETICRLLGSDRRFVLCVDELMIIDNAEFRTNMLNGLASCFQEVYMRLPAGHKLPVLLVTSLRGTVINEVLVQRKLVPVPLAILDSKSRDTIAEKLLDVVRNHNPSLTVLSEYTDRIQWRIRCMVHLCGNHFRSLEERVLQWCQDPKFQQAAALAIDEMLKADEGIAVGCPTAERTKKLFAYFSPWAQGRRAPDYHIESSLDATLRDYHLISIKSRSAQSVEVHVSLLHLYQGADQHADCVPMRCVAAIGSCLTNPESFAKAGGLPLALERVFFAALLFRIYTLTPTPEPGDWIPLSDVLPGCPSDISIHVGSNPLSMVNSQISPTASEGKATLVSQVDDCLYRIGHPGGVRPRGNSAKGIEAALMCRHADAPAQPAVLVVTCKFEEHGTNTSAFQAASDATQRPGLDVFVLGVAPRWSTDLREDNPRWIAVEKDDLIDLFSPWGALPLLSRFEQIEDKAV